MQAVLKKQLIKLTKKSNIFKDVNKALQKDYRNYKINK